MEADVHHGRQLLFERSRKRAFDCLQKNEYARAYAHLIVALTIQPDDCTVTDALLFTLGIISNELESQEKYDEILVYYQEALELLPNNSQLLHGLATFLFRLGHIESAISYFQRAYRENPSYVPSLYSIDNIRNALVERWHFTMLNDKTRNSSFAQAIKNAVVEGYDSVLDIGAGTGILSMIAADAGAKSVYACEGSSTMFVIMQNVIEASKKNVYLINKFSYDIKIPTDLPERVTLVVTETFDAGLFGEQVLETLSHAWKHLLKDSNLSDESPAVDTFCKKARVLPQSAVIWAVPIECDTLSKHICVDKRVLEKLGITNGAVSSSASYDDPYSTERLNAIQGGYKCLSEVQQILSVDFNNPEEVNELLNGKSVPVIFTCTSAGRIDAIALWFDLFVDDNVTISTSPENMDTCWEQAVYYVTSDRLHGPSNITCGAVVDVKFLCKNHLILQKVTTQPDAKLEDAVYVKSPTIHALNALHSDGVFALNLMSQRPVSTIVDVSAFPFIGLNAVQKGMADNLVVLPSKHLWDLVELQNCWGIPKEKVRVMSYEDICTDSLVFDAFIVQPVETCGLLSKNVFEDIALLQTKCATQPTMIYPQQLGLYAMLVDSAYLQKQVKIISNDNCLGYNIAEFLNAYQSNICQDIQLSTLPHHQLSSSIKLQHIDLDKITLLKSQLQSWTDFHGLVSVKITKSGNISAIPFWFDIKYSSDIIVDLLAADLWKQAAVILDKAIPVCEGETVVVKWNCTSSYLNISVDKS